MRLKSYRNYLLPFIAGSIVALVAFIIRYLFVLYVSLDLFDIVDNTYESLIFYCGLGGLRFAVIEYLNNINLTMNANPGVPTNPGAGNQANPGAGNQANPGGGNQANPGAGNPINPGVNVNNITDPTGVGLQPFNPARTSQPYAGNFANRLDTIRGLNGGRASPAYNTHLANGDRRWVESYLISIGRNPRIAQNSPAFCSLLRNLN